MVTTTSDYNLLRYRATISKGFDGVVRTSSDGRGGTGSLLFDGQVVLTAAHVLFSKDGKFSANVFFETASGTIALKSKHVLIHPNYTDDGKRYDSNNDLALIWLSGSAPLDADRYALYRDSDEIGKQFHLVGYGGLGTGQTGNIVLNYSPHKRLVAQNTFDAYAAETKIDGSQLIADFDSGLAANDALNNDRVHLGLGLDEGLVANGDSGGPALINGKIAGVASYVSHSSYDVDELINSSFGEIGGWQSVSFYQQWIDQSLRAQYIGAPATPEDVVKTVLEGNSGTRLTFFLLQFTGVRTSFNQLLSVEYATRDGTAKAGEDYLATQGVLILYPGETQAVIAVEIIGDFVAEPDEWFFLDVFNPVGGSFGNGITMLTGMRTILNDDNPTIQFFRGDSDNNTIIGSSENDIIIGGAGSDFMTGGSGFDLFVFEFGSTRLSDGWPDTITDFETGIDRISINSNLNLDLDNLSELRGGSVLIANGADQDLRFDGFTFFNPILNFNDFSQKASLVFKHGSFDVFVVFNIYGEGNALVAIDSNRNNLYDDGDSTIILTGIESVDQIAATDFVIFS